MTTYTRSATGAIREAVAYVPGDWQEYPLGKPSIATEICVDIDVAPHLVQARTDGCELGATHCVDCPLPQCVHDLDKHAQHSFRASRRYAEIRDLLKRNTKWEVAAAMGCGIRTIHRAMAAAT